MTLPLEGLRVADFSWVIAGPYATQHLVQLGAEVIRIESAEHMDISRRLAPYADGVEGEERSGHNHGYNMGKKSVTLNLRRPEAQDLALEIVRRSDMLIENFSFGLMDRFNLGYRRLLEANPDIIYLSSSGMGRSGPYRQYVTWGPPLLAYAGLASVTGQPGSPGERDVGGVWADHLSGLSSAFGALVALEARERQGIAQRVEYSMAEVVTAQLPEALAAYGCTGEAPGPTGNRDRTMAPHGIFPCNDGWVAIAVQDDDDWRAFRDIVPGPAWWRDASLEALDGRKAKEKAIEQHITSWSRARRVRDAVGELRGANIAAGSAANLAELADDPVLAERGFYIDHDHPEVGKRRLPGIGWRDPSTTFSMPHAPFLGQHNWEVFVDMLGLTPERFAELVGDGVIV